MSSETHSTDLEPDEEDCAATDEPHASRDAAACISQTTFVKRVGVAGPALVLIVFYLALIFATLWQPDFRTTSLLHAGLSLLAFYIDTFAFHGGVLVAVLGVALVIGRRWRLALAALPAVGLTVGPAVLCYLPPDPPVIAGDSFTVMTVNLFGVNRRPGGLAHEIAEADPDVLLVQEYNGRWHQALFSVVGERYPYVETIPRRDSYGMAVYSKLAFENPGPVRLHLAGIEVPCMKVRVRIDGRPVTVFNIHLVAPKGVGRFRQKCAQLADLLETAAAEPDPVVLAGDFNFTRGSRSARTIDRYGLKACHDLAGWGRGATWPVGGALRYFPGIRIDHIYLSPELTCSSCATGTGEGSDHRPIIAVIGFAG